MMLGLLLATTMIITPTDQKIVIDGSVDEAAWRQALKIDQFVEMHPGDNIEPPVRTEAWMTYDRETLYIAFRCFDPDPSKIRAIYADRDGPGSDDLVAVLLDTFKDERKAFYFQVNPLGVQLDATFVEPVGNDYSWDTIWTSAGRITATGYEVELAIPFKSIRFPDKPEQVWGFTVERYYPRDSSHRITSHRNDRSLVCWLCLEDTLEGLKEIRPGKNLELIPAVTALRTDARPDAGSPMEEGDFETEASLSGTWGITSNLTANATINPDFSHVEADAFQLDVNRRFSLYYPEKRPFFMEGANYFGTYFNTVYTRSIADPDWGLKFTGKEGRNSYGLLVAQDAECDLLVPGVEGSYGVGWEETATATAARYQRDFWADSTVGAVATWRGAGNYSSWLAGADGRVRLGRQDEIQFQALTSSTRYPGAEENSAFDGESTDGGAYFLLYEHFTREWTVDLLYQKRDEGFRADLGFEPQVGDEQHSASANRRWYGNGGKWYSMISLFGNAYETLDDGGDLLARGLGLYSYVAIPFKTTSINLGYNRYKERYEGVDYPDRYRASFSSFTRPAKWMTLQLNATDYRGIDYINGQDGDGRDWSATLTLRPGKRLQGGLTYQNSRMDVNRGWLYRAELYYASVNYFFTHRLFFRGILQRYDVEQNPDYYRFTVSQVNKRLGSQMLLSYRVNPFTLVYLGYSDSGLQNDWTDPTTMSRTFFVKLSYAWRP